MSIISVFVLGRNRILFGFFVLLIEGVLFIMKLYYRMFRYFIVVSVIVLIFFFFIFEFVVSDRVMSVYLRYIV